jgi:hypothetical protein
VTELDDAERRIAEAFAASSTDPSAAASSSIRTITVL